MPAVLISAFVLRARLLFARAPGLPGAIAIVGVGAFQPVSMRGPLEILGIGIPVGAAGWRTVRPIIAEKIGIAHAKAFG